MDWNDYRIQFQDEAKRTGRSDAFIDRCLAYAEPLVTRGLPVLYDISQLSVEVGLDEEQIRALIENPAASYLQYAIPKLVGGYRHISEPILSLRKTQLWILRRILNSQMPHDAAMAFTRGRSIRMNAQQHVGQRMVLSLDIRDFFGTIKHFLVLDVFKSMGYSTEIADALTQLTQLWGSLPQGAPTSPAISNLIMRSPDKELTRFAQANSIRYTRYADDMTFSGIFRVNRIIDKVTRVLRSIGLELNENKTRLMLRHQQQEVTGVVVNERIQAPRLLRRRLRQEIYYLKKFSLEEHCLHRFSLYGNRLDHLRGLAEFVLFLNPMDRDAREAIGIIGRVRFS